VKQNGMTCQRKQTPDVKCDAVENSGPWSAGFVYFRGRLGGAVISNRVPASFAVTCSPDNSTTTATKAFGWFVISAKTRSRGPRLDALEDEWCASLGALYSALMLKVRFIHSLYQCRLSRCFA